MGDRTTTRTTVATADLDAVKKLIFGNDTRKDAPDSEDIRDNDDGTTSFPQYDVNYGGDYDANALQKAGIPFLIEHDAGGNYPAGYTAFDGGTRCSAYGDERGLTIAFDERTGEANTEDLETARRFAALRRNTLEAMRNRS